MKFSRIRRWLSLKTAPKPMASRLTHTAYTEQVMHQDGVGFTGRVYDYASGKLLEEFEGRGGRPAAAKAAAKILKKYRREE